MLCVTKQGPHKEDLSGCRWLKVNLAMVFPGNRQPKSDITGKFIGRRARMAQMQSVRVQKASEQMPFSQMLLLILMFIWHVCPKIIIWIYHLKHTRTRSRTGRSRTLYSF